MKTCRAQINAQVFTVIMVAVVIGVAVIAGLQMAGTTTETHEQVVRAQLENELERKLADLSYGSRTVEHIELPAEYEEVCFSGTLDPTTLPASFVREHPQIAQEIGTGKNVFLIDEEGHHVSFKLHRLAVEDTIVCVRTNDGTLDLILESQGATISVDAADPDDIGVSVPAGTTGTRVVVTAPDFGASVEIPPNVRIIYNGGSAQEDIVVKRSADQNVPPSLDSVSQVYEFTPSGTRFLGEGASVTICLDHALPAVTPELLQQFKLYYETPAGKWVPIDQDCPNINYHALPDGRCVEVTGLCHFTDFVLVAPPGSCTAGTCASPPVSECTDSDGGADIYTPGTVKGKLSDGTSGAAKDYCRGQNELTEYICSDNTVSAMTVYCPDGCVGGRCLESHEQRSCSFRAPGLTSPGEARYCFYNEAGWEHLDGNPKVVCYFYVQDETSDYPINLCEDVYDCTPGEVQELLEADGSKSYSEVCIRQKKDAQEETTGCTDPDGLNPNFRATTRGPWWEDGKQVKLTDTCLSTTLLSEYYCDGDTVKMKSISCPDGCEDGRCGSAETSCVDSDGYNYYTKGTVRYQASNSGDTSLHNTGGQATRITGWAVHDSCGNGELDPGEECDGNVVDGGYCQDCHVVCLDPTTEFDGTACVSRDPCDVNKPVCGANGVTFRNACTAQRAQVRVRCEGSCPCSDNLDAQEFLETLEELGADCTKIAQWSQDNQDWESYTGDTGTSFRLIPGKAYYLDCENAPELLVKSDSPTRTTTVEVTDGTTMIALGRDISVGNFQNMLRTAGCTKVAALEGNSWRELSAGELMHAGQGYAVTCARDGRASFVSARVLKLDPGNKLIGIPLGGHVTIEPDVDARCGNGVLDTGEECDPDVSLGELGNTARCTATCRIDCVKPGEWYDAATQQCTSTATCPQDVKECPDGTIVHRTGKDCSFEPCPTGGKVFTDSCLTSDVVIEYVCDAGLPAKKTYECPYGCEDGRCKEAPRNEEEQLCRQAGGTWRTFPTSCADFCWAQSVAPSSGQQEHDLNTAGAAVFTGFVTYPDGDSNGSSTAESCPDIYDPVCGADGETYTNKCTAEHAGVTIDCNGPCPCSTPAVATASELLDALNRLGADCDALSYWDPRLRRWMRYAPGAQLRDADFTLQPAQVYVLSCAEEREIALAGTGVQQATLQLAPGQTYFAVPVEGYTTDSLLAAIQEAGGQCSNIRRYTDGQWLPYSGPLQPGEAYSIICTGHLPLTVPVTGEGVTEAALTTKKDAAFSTPFAGEFSVDNYAPPLACTQEYAPVCGADGETYGNACQARTAGVTIACEGRCPCSRCTDTPTESCDCGPNACWDGTRCVTAVDNAGCGNGICEFGEDDSCPTDCGPGSNCPLPYHHVTAAGECDWFCADGTEPDAQAGECVCQPGYTEAGTDPYGRRVCKLHGGSFCGDGSVQSPNADGVYEECDDGNFDDTDGCTRECKKCAQQGLRADVYGNGRCCDGLTLEGGICNLPSIPPEGYCGDSIVQWPNADGIYEECDFGGDTDACRDCKHVDCGPGGCTPPECGSDTDCPSDACTQAICEDGHCTGIPVEPQCPPPTNITCGEPLEPMNGCGKCEGVGLWCPGDLLCDTTGITYRCIKP